MRLLRHEDSRYPARHFYLEVTPARAVLRSFHGVDAVTGGAVEGATIHRDLAGTWLLPGQQSVLDPAELSGAEWCDHAAWFFAVASSGEHRMPFNRFPHTAISKTDSGHYLSMLRDMAVAVCWVPFASNRDLTQAVWKIGNRPDFVACANVPVTGTLDTGALRNWSMAPFLPKVRLSGPRSIARDDYAQVTVSVLDGETGSVVDTPCTVYVEAKSGYLPRVQVPVEGTARFKAGALGLEPGDSVELSAGFKHVSGLARLSIPVTA
jgi:hypothetical protein